jgi:uncharacterized protein with von Willebrand factor type A (vWA) domain
MHPSELMDAHGGIDPRVTSPTPGIVWLQRIARHFDRAVWINPEPARDWADYTTARVIQRVVPMFQLSVDGLTEAVKALVGARAMAA